MKSQKLSNKSTKEPQKIEEPLNKDLRKRILEKGREMNSSHFSSAFSCLDSIKYLYDHVLIEGKDVFIMSKGHGEMALFAVLESIGKKPNWTIHLEYNESNGVYATTGSLGHGLPIALGRAFAKKIKGETGKVYVLLGDGEMEEGSNWEALTIANSLAIDNLSLLIDWNKYQAAGCVKDVACFDDNILQKRLEAFGCNVIKINGHDKEELIELTKLKTGLNAVILDTIKGKGISYLEGCNIHSCNLKKNEDDYKKAIEELN